MPFSLLYDIFSSLKLPSVDISQNSIELDVCFTLFLCLFQVKRLKRLAETNGRGEPGVREVLCGGAGKRSDWGRSCRSFWTFLLIFSERFGSGLKRVSKALEAFFGGDFGVVMEVVFGSLNVEPVTFGKFAGDKASHARFALNT